MARVFSPPLLALILGIAVSIIFLRSRGVPLYVYLFNLAVFLAIYIIAWYIATVKQLSDWPLVMLTLFYLLVYDKDPFEDFLFIVGVYASALIFLLLDWLERRAKSSAQLSS